MDRSSIVLTAEQQLLVENSLEFVHWTIANLIPKSNCRMEYDDLFQEGCVALCHAAASYHGGTSFKTYAITVIRNHLIDCCRYAQIMRTFPMWTQVRYLPSVRNTIAVSQNSVLTRLF